MDKKLTAEDRFWAAIQESDRQRKENERFLTEKLAETDRILSEKLAETDRIFTEKLAETDKQLKESIEKRDKLFKDLKKEIGGIANSNGEFAEKYFENVFCRNMTFAGMHFHDMIIRKRLDDRKRRDEFDIIMLNENNAVIVETKYKAHESDIEELIQKAESFRYWYPEHKDHNVYLCLASLRFEDNIIGKARKKGIAVCQQLGDKTVVNDENLKAY
jgi:predicted RNase H-like nuclease (RuvC/YqgF family)